MMCTMCFWNHIWRNTAVGLTHVFLVAAFAETSTRFDWLLYFSYNYGELGRDIKNTLETQACLVFHAIRTIRFQIVIILVITFFAVQWKKEWSRVSTTLTPRHWAVRFDIFCPFLYLFFFCSLISLVFFLRFSLFHLPSFSVVLCHFRLEFFLLKDWYEFCTERVDLNNRVTTCLQEVPGVNLGRNTEYPDWGFSWFFQFK